MGADTLEDAAAQALEGAALNNLAAAQSAEAAAILANLQIGGSGGGGGGTGGGGEAVPIDTEWPEVPLNTHVPSTALVKQALDEKLASFVLDELPQEGSESLVTSGALYEFLKPIDWPYSQRIGSITTLPGQYFTAVASGNTSNAPTGGFRVRMASMDGLPWGMGDYTDYEALTISVFRGGELSERFRLTGDADDPDCILRRKDLPEQQTLPEIVTAITSEASDEAIPTAKAVLDFVRSGAMEVDLSEIKALIGELQQTLENFAYGTGAI